jgi:RNA polymerase sigma-70 factor (ECF subfamily)
MADDDHDSGGQRLAGEMQPGRERFLALVADVRAELHRYCARMTGSVSDGEDIVQETLARAWFLLPDMQPVPPLRPWLFQIAHNRALDHLRRYERRMGRPLDEGDAQAGDPAAGADETLAEGEAVRAAVSRFLQLPPGPRSAVILKDVLGHSLEEIAALHGQTLPAVKAALHRGREQLRALEDQAPAAAAPVSAAVARWAQLFNERNWEALRAMLADDVRLDLVTRAQRSGRGAVSSYFSNYDSKHDWFLVPAWLEGREVVAVFRQRGDAEAAYWVELDLERDAVRGIRDFRYVPYIARDAPFVLAPPR